MEIRWIKNFRLCLTKKLWHVFWRYSIFLSVDSWGTYFPTLCAFWIAYSRMKIAVWVMFIESRILLCNWLLSSFKRACKSGSAIFLGRFFRCFSLRPKFPSLNLQKKSLLVFSDKELFSHASTRGDKISQPMLLNESREAKLTHMTFFQCKFWH